MRQIRSIVNARVAKNFLALAILQGGNYLLPLILIPFLIRVLGMETFGEWVFAVSFVSIFRTFVNYGFDMTATRAVSIHRDDRVYISQLYVTVVLTRFIIFALSCLVLLGLALIFSNIWSIVILAQLSMLVLLGEALFPIWLFQGMERMATITKLRLGYRAVFVLVVILLVKEPDDVLLIPIIEGAGSLVAGLIALYIAGSTYRLQLRMPTGAFVWREIVDGSSIFFSYVAVHFYTTINTVLLGVMAGSIAVAQYSIAEKIYFAVRGMLGPIVQALFPSLSRLYEEDREAYWRSARMFVFGFFLILVFLSSSTFVFAENLVRVIAGQADPVATGVLHVLAIAMVFAMATLLSALLVVQRKGKTLMAITFSTTALNLIIVFPLLHQYGIIGMAFAFLITQAFQTIVQLSIHAGLIAPHSGLFKSRSKRI